MRRLAALLLLPFPAFSQGLAVCASSTKDYVVGAKLPSSGLFLQRPNGEWLHVGYNHPFLSAIDSDPRNRHVLYLAAGNGLFRVAIDVSSWTQLTGSDVTELRDVAVDPKDPKTIYFAWVHGVRVTHNGGESWEELGATLHRRFVEAIRVDRTDSKRLVIGGEEGIFHSENSGKTWEIAGAAGFQILRIEQSPHNTCDWLATTQGGGLFASHDCAKTFENVERIGVGRDLYGIAFDPSNPQRIAIGGWGPGVAITEDGGKTWQERNQGLPRADVWGVIFDPIQAGRLWASVQDGGMFVSNDAGLHWRPTGLEGAEVRCMKLIP